MTNPVEQPATIALPNLAPAVGESKGEDPGLALEGLFVPASGESAAAAMGAVMAPPHPLYGGSMENPVVTEVADACRTLGLASLRFNWRGVGASAGSPSGEMEAGVEDYGAALSFVEDSTPGAVMACGYSFGAAAAVVAGTASPRVQALLLVAPPLPMLDRAAVAGFAGPVLVAAAEHDQFSSAGELRDLAASLDDGHYVLIEGTDHFFMTGLADLGREARHWLTGAMERASKG